MQARFAVLAVLAIAVVTTAPLPVLADPPPWAPAHGYRKEDRGGDVVVVQPKRRDCGGIDNQFVGSTAGAAGGVLLGGLAGQSADRSRGC